MRLAIYIRSVESARGAERVAINVARGLASRGHSVDFLVEERGSWLGRELGAEHADVRVLNLRDGRRTSLPDRLLQAGALLRHLLSAPRALLMRGDACIVPVAQVLFKDAAPIAALRRYLHEGRPHAILSFLNYPNTVLLLAASLHRGDTRFIVSVRNHMSVAAAHNESAWVRSVPRLMRRLFGLADAVVTPSIGVADDVAAITGIGRDRISVIYNPVFRPELTEMADAPVDHPWLADGNEPVILGSGKFKPQKDFPTLLQAFAKVRAVRPARLIVLGEGEGEGQLREMTTRLGIAQDVDFPGHVANPFAYYRRASVFVLSSVWEGLPNALIEAMACGCPVVSTDCPSGPCEILDGGRFGTLVPVGEIDKMAEAILATLGGAPSRSVLIDRAREFSLDQAVQRFEAVMAG
ncbi:MAG TPA: glycosyltransferase [Rhodospirillales bacterium]|nr:glycosyltransferase [Rhodospirillales bacterium]